MPSQSRFELTVFEISGPDREEFLQGLVTNAVARAESGLVYAAMLTPQGKFVADFLVFMRAEALLVDVDSRCAPELAEKFAMYKLRSRVAVAESGLQVSRGLGSPPPEAMADPRHPDLGWRLYGGSPSDEIGAEGWERIRVRHCIPETLVELISDQTYILEAGFERLNGVDFRKGCYVGQEVTARMKHKANLRKGLARVGIRGTADVGTEITANGRSVGVVYTQADGHAIAQLRFDRLRGQTLAAGAAQIVFEERAAPQE